jgi:hypothetical protein
MRPQVRSSRHAGSDANAARQPWLLTLRAAAALVAIWVIGSQHAENPNYRAGTLDLLLVAVMATASFAIRRATTATA